MRKSLHYMRILWTVVCGVACVLLVVLWVRSYRWSDLAALPQFTSRRSLQIGSVQGIIAVHLIPSTQWWRTVSRTQAIFVPGKGYTVPGQSGYFDGDGTPLEFNFPQVSADSTIYIASARLFIDPSSADKQFIIVSKLANRWGFGLGIYSYVVPHWFCALILATFSVAPWIRRQFSLRTLLIVTTLVAVVLGLIVWQVRQ
jgi:hypothetical protein